LKYVEILELPEVMLTVNYILYNLFSIKHINNNEGERMKKNILTLIVLSLVFMFAGCYSQEYRECAEECNSEYRECSEDCEDDLGDCKDDWSDCDVNCDYDDDYGWACWDDCDDDYDDCVDETEECEDDCVDEKVECWLDCADE